MERVDDGASLPGRPHIVRRCARKGQRGETRTSGTALTQRSALGVRRVHVRSQLLIEVLLQTLACGVLGTAANSMVYDVKIFRGFSLTIMQYVVVCVELPEAVKPALRVNETCFAPSVEEELVECVVRPLNISVSSPRLTRRTTWKGVLTLGVKALPGDAGSNGEPRTDADVRGTICLFTCNSPAWFSEVKCS